MSPGRGDISASHAASFKVVKETGMFDLLALGTKFAQPRVTKHQQLSIDIR